MYSYHLKMRRHAMTKADLHLHSKYSDHPSEWFLQRLGASESYTEPEYIYRMAKERGMDFVTITDHNKIEGSLLLKENHPHDVFTGVEFTTYFPENGCKIHVLVYGLDERQFDEIQSIRKNIYDFREYIRDEGLAHSVAHGTFSVNGKLTIEILERMILLFDVFEGINGSRDKVNNSTWVEVLSRLTPDHIEDIYSKYRIEPFSNESWVKGFTGGSDDHAGLFIGQTFTQAKAHTIEEFLEVIKEKKSFPQGRHNNYQSLAFTLYKIAYDFSKHKKDDISYSFLNHLTEFIFDKKDIGLKNRIRLRRLKSADKKNGNRIYRLLYELIENIENNKVSSLEHRLYLAYQKIAEIADEFFKILLISLEKDIKTGDLISIIKNVSASIPGVFLSIPFFSTIKLMSKSRNLLFDLKARYGQRQKQRSPRILWFTDTFYDLNGVSVTLKKIESLAEEKDLNIYVVSSVRPEEIQDGISRNTINLPYIYSFHMPGYERYILKVPSVLNSLEQIYRFDPDEIFISTPGPVGVLGLLAAKLLNIKSVGIYHTDFALQAHKIIKDEATANILESFVKSFYSSMDEIRVPTKEYIGILERRGFSLPKMKIFRRGIDTKLFSPRRTGRAAISKKFNIKDGFHLLYVGRVSQDKELDFLLDVYTQLIKEDEKINLIIVGDGPYLSELKAKAKRYKRIIFAGLMDYEELPEMYSGADLFVFPSTADTFGMVVLEAQSCGLPVVVSDRGGPKEILIEHRTGLIAKAGCISDWKNKISFMKNMIEIYPTRYSRMKKEARKNVLSRYTWGKVLRELSREPEIMRSRLIHKKPSLLFET